MMQRLDTLAGRTILVSLIGITLMHVLSLWSYELALQQEMSDVQDARLVERLVAIRRSLAAAPEAGRDEIAHRLSGGPMEIHWGKAALAIATAVAPERLAMLPGRIRESAPEIGDGDLVVGSGGADGDPHVALLSLRLPDRSWANISLFSYRHPHNASHGTLLSTTLMALGVVLLSVFIARWLTRPIRAVAEAVRTMRPGGEPMHIPGSGPKEVRDLAVAFNDMQSRIVRLVDERTRALAAVSHDLRTPLTRLKLRIEDLASPGVGEAMTRDIAEVEQMIDATLSYLSGQSTSETPRLIDLTALLETLVDEASDLGQSVTMTAPRHVVVRGRRMALKRAFTNLIQNAVKYGERARITSEEVGREFVVHIDDDGPGIPEDKLAAVVEPFVRLEASRNRETGGAGLGLTIAKASIEADGGRLVLTNRAGGGLRVSVALPQAN